MRLTVIGCGHLGATHAACMAEIGHDVLGVDIDEDKIALLNSGRAWFAEPGLDEMLTRHTRRGSLRFTTNFAEADAFGTVHFLGVGTPGNAAGDGYDLSQVFGAVRALAPYLRENSLIIGKSTVPPGTASTLAAELAGLAEAAGLAGTAGLSGAAGAVGLSGAAGLSGTTGLSGTAGAVGLSGAAGAVGLSGAAGLPARGREVAWNPEFLREAHAVDDTLRPDRIVVGVPSPAAEATVREVYRPLTDAGVPLIVTDPPTAELVKGAANAFLSTKISFINAMADICGSAGADVRTLADALGMDARIGRAFLTAGIGYGGGCLPKDIRGLGSFARSAGAGTAARLLAVVDDINTSRRMRVVDLLAELLGPLDGKRIALWGAAFKPGTDDVRDSPALEVADRLHRRGARVTVYDPQAAPNALVEYPHLRYADTAAAAAQDAEAVLVATAWPEFAEADPDTLRTGRPLLVDACQAVDPGPWRAAGWTVAAPFPTPARPPPGTCPILSNACSTAIEYGRTAVWQNAGPTMRARHAGRHPGPGPAHGAGTRAGAPSRR